MQKTSNRKLSLSTRVAQALHFLDDETGAPLPPMPATKVMKFANHIGIGATAIKRPTMPKRL